MFDVTTGGFKRMWGAYGNKPDDAKNSPYNAAQILQSAALYTDEVPEKEKLSVGLAERTQRTPERGPGLSP